MQVKNSIRWQMVVVICSVIFVSFLLFSTTVRNILLDDYREVMQNNDRQSLQILSFDITKAIAKSLMLIDSASHNPDIMQLNEQEKVNILSQVLNEDNSFELLSIINADGTQVANALPTKLTANEIFQEYQELKNQNEMAIGPIRYSNSTKNIVLPCIHKIEYNGEVQGVIVANINLSYLREKIMNYNDGNKVSLYLLDQSGMAISHPDGLSEGLYNYKTLRKTRFQRDHGGYIIYDENGNPKIEDKPFIAPTSFVDIIRLVVEHNGKGDTEYSDDHGKKFFCVYQLVDLPFINDNWSLLLVHADNDMTSLIDKLFVKALVAGFIMLIFASFTIIYYSEKVTKPIFQIVEMANRVRAGDLSGQLNIQDENEIGLLADNINHMIQGLRLTRQKTKETENQIKAIAYHDTLTGLPNRMHFLIYLRNTLDKAIHGRFYASLLFIDVDKFKSVNDNYGHAVGDGLLIEFSKRIVEIAGRKEIACRFGGDEFLLFLVGYDYEDTKSVCDRLVKTMREPFIISGNKFFLSTSIGAALFPKDADGIEALMEKADAALYVSKRNGRDQYNFFEEGMETVPIDERD